MLFTLLLWLLILLVYISGKGNKTNRWCSISIFIFSLGTLKEFYFYDIVPRLAAMSSPDSMAGYTAAYSVMTAVLYYFALPSSLLFAMYFSNYNFRSTKAFAAARILIFLPPATLIFIYAPGRIRYYQLNDMTFWYVLSVYNVGYGLMMTAVMVHTVLNEKNPAQHRQKKWASLVVLPALWFWLITIFLIHSLQIKSLFKLWQANVIIICMTVVFYIFMAFREGIMGLKLKSENFNWDTDMKMINQSANYTGHMLKNETSKITWCLDRLKLKFQGDIPEELAIIERSTGHLCNFIEKTKLLSSKISLDLQQHSLIEIISESVEMMSQHPLKRAIGFRLCCPEEICLLCDRVHLVEVLNNLILNAFEAMGQHGTIEISVDCKKRKNYLCITISDTGCGIGREKLGHVFEPFYTTKMSKSNLGLGLSYCNNVISRHKGFIKIESVQEKGTVAALYFPYAMRTERKVALNRT